MAECLHKGKKSITASKSYFYQYTTGAAKKKEETHPFLQNRTVHLPLVSSEGA